jgi:hypothetical protein
MTTTAEVKAHCAKSKQAPVEVVKVMANDLLREMIEQAHMSGQADAGVDPSYSNARAYYDSLFSTKRQENDMKAIQVRVMIQIPKMPNFFRLADGTCISVADIADEDLSRIADAWKASLLEHAANKRTTQEASK